MVGAGSGDGGGDDGENGAATPGARRRARVEKYISPGERVELLALIGEFVFTIGPGYFGDGVARGFKRPFG